MSCSKQVAPECIDDHYANDRACKACRRQLVKQNRQKNAEYYREYDRARGSRQSSEFIRDYRRNNPKKYAAHTAVGNAVRGRRIDKPVLCSSCGTYPRQMEAHHDNYDRPLTVRWLCSPCHKQHHAVSP